VSLGKRASFVVRVVERGPGRVDGVIERVATGAKEAFSGIEGIGPIIQRMLRRDASSRTRKAPARTHDAADAGGQP
jgi:hypothetical protein